MTATRFSKFAFIVLGYGLLAIVWGAFVRATESGGGCGSHWPDCNGEIIPLAPRAATMIEFAHRTTTGILGLLAVALVIWSLIAFPRGHGARRASIAAFGFTCVSAVIGFWLVHYKLVEKNDSFARALILSLHFVNTMLLIGSVTLAAWYGAGGRAIRFGKGPLGLAIVGAAAALMLLGMSGSVTSLGDTLYPAKNSLEVIQAGLSLTGHFLVRLRIWHPVIAVAVALYLLFLSGFVADLRPAAKRGFRVLMAVVALQLLLGLVNVRLHAPIPIALLHLFVADLLWVVFVWSGAAALESLGSKTALVPENQLVVAS